MNDGVAGGEQFAASGVESETVASDIASHGRDAPGGHLGEALFAEFRPQTIEGIVLEDLSGQALLNRGPAAGAHEQHEFTVGDRPQEAFEQVGAQEAGGASDEEAFAGEGVSDHG
jgi:hypothetical protein